jgi:tetratricopeptide (TPR) repeat protein
VAPLIAAAREHLNAGRLDAAVQAMESAYRAAPGDAETSRWLCEAYNQRAVARYSDDHLREAIADLQRSLELDPSQDEIRTQLTRAQSRLRRLSTIEGERARD